MHWLAWATHPLPHFHDGASYASKQRYHLHLCSTFSEASQPQKVLNSLLRPADSFKHTRKQEPLQKKLTQLGYNKSQFNLHSLHTSGASAAANSGVPDWLFKCNGGRNWGLQRRVTLKTPRNHCCQWQRAWTRNKALSVTLNCMQLWKTDSVVSTAGLKCCVK